MSPAHDADSVVDEVASAPKMDSDACSNPSSFPAAAAAGDDESPPCRQLWLGDVSQEMNCEATLKETFSRYGNIDRVTVFPNKSYAFVVFKNVEDAIAAKTALHGKMRIQFAKPAKPSNRLWIGGIDLSVTKEKLEEDLKKFGVLKEFKFMRDRNYAIVEYEKLESAVSAVETLNHQRIGNGELRVDFVRSHSIRREGGPALGSIRLDERAEFRPCFPPGYTNVVTAVPNIFQPFQPPMIQNFYHTPAAQVNSTNPGEQASKALWIGYPASLKVNEDILRRAFILFGEIEHIKMIPGRSFCFVQFRNIDEARRAKEGLQGRLFNNPRVQIRFANSEIGPFQKMPDDRGLLPWPHRQNAPVHPEWVMPRPPLSVYERPNLTSFSNAAMFLPFCQPMQYALNTCGGPSPSVASSLSAGMGSPPNIHNPSSSSCLIGTGGAGIPVLNVSVTDPIRELSSTGKCALDGSNLVNEDFLSRDSKKMKLDESQLPVPCVEEPQDDLRLSEASLQYQQNNEAQASAPNLLHSYPYAPQTGSNNCKFNMSASILAPKITDKSEELTMVDSKWKWQGVIAKAGTAVCRALSHQVNKGIQASLPEVVNCFARTDLDVLAKHFYQASGFGLISFVPDGDSETQRYQEFLCYLGGKYRAGVAKLDDGTTLFLVPPSKFSVNVLQMHDSLLFGVLLKLPHVGSQLSLHQHHPSAGALTVPSMAHPLTSKSVISLTDPGINSEVPPPAANSHTTSTSRAMPVSGLEFVNKVSPTGHGIQEFTRPLFLSSHSISMQDKSDGIGFISTPRLSSDDKDIHSQTTIHQTISAHVNRASFDGQITPESRQFNEIVEEPNREALKLYHEEINNPVKILPQEKQNLTHVENPHLQQPGILNPGQIPIQSSVPFGLQRTWNSTLQTSGQLFLNQGNIDPEDEKQKRFQATLQLAATLLQNIHKPQESAKQN